MNIVNRFLHISNSLLSNPINNTYCLIKGPNRIIKKVNCDNIVDFANTMNKKNELTQQNLNIYFRNNHCTYVYIGMVYV